MILATTRWMLPLALTLATGCTPKQETTTDCLGRSVQTASLTGTALLTWDAPTTRTDGSPFDDLAGYKIYYGIAPDQLKCQIEIRDPTRTASRVPELSPGTWYFAVVSFDSAQVESELSGIVSKQID